MTKGAVYAHFADKDQLFVEVIEWSMGRRLAELSSALTDAGSVPEQTQDAASWFARFLDQDPQWSLLFFEFWLHAARKPALRRRHSEYRRAAAAAVAALISERAEGARITLAEPATVLAMAVLASRTVSRLNGSSSPTPTPKTSWAWHFAGCWQSDARRTSS